MTEDQFAAAVARRRIKPRSIALARLVLVEGLGQSAVARRFGVSRQAVRQTIDRVERAYREAMGCPPGWTCVTVCVPVSEAARIRAIERQALRAENTAAGAYPARYAVLASVLDLY